MISSGQKFTCLSDTPGCKDKEKEIFQFVLVIVNKNKKFVCVSQRKMWRAIYLEEVFDA